MKPPIYEPKGAAREYGELALNIYTGCPHRCFYCYVPNVLHCDREKFHTDVRPRPNIVEETQKQIEREHITDKLIHLCFTCDPYPTGCDSSVTREIIKLLKEHGNHVQILTKGNGYRDFDLLDKNDWYGITLDGGESNDIARLRLCPLESAHRLGINTWISFEPILDTQKELAETIGIEAYRKLVTHYGGERVFIPRLDSIVSSNRKSLITSALNTESETDIMKFFCMTKREFERFKLGCK